LLLVTYLAHSFLMRVIMSDRIVNSPIVDQLAINPPTSTGQTDARLINGSTSDSNTSEPTLSNKEAPKYPLDTTADASEADSSILSHTALISRDQSNNASQSSAPTTTAGSNYSTLSINALIKEASEGDPNAQFE
jgi:hypothetical protein